MVPYARTWTIFLWKIDKDGDMIEIIKAIIFGMVEGITEWLPISSTGHMILLDEFVKLNVSEDFFEMFLVVIQLGAILAVVVLFIKSIWPFALSHRNPCPVKSTGILSYCRKDIFELWFKIIVACVPAAVVGLLFDEFFESLFYNSIFPFLGSKPKIELRAHLATLSSKLNSFSSISSHFSVP